MARSIVSLRPRIEAEAAFTRLIELAERGDGMEEGALVEAINGFLAFSRAPADTPAKWNWFTKADKAGGIVQDLRKGLERLRTGRPFVRPVGTLEEFEDAVVWIPRSSYVCRPPSDDPRILFFRRVFDLLSEVAPWMRLCHREGCGRLFLYRRPKQLFCSDSCAQRVRMERFMAHGGRGRPRKKPGAPNRKRPGPAAR